MHGICGVYAQRRTAEDDAYNVRIIHGIFIIRKDFAESMQFTHPPAYQLGRLGPEIEDYYPLHLIIALFVFPSMHTWSSDPNRT